MRVLLDTHALLWAAFHKDLLSARVRRVIQSPANEILVSAASAWEIATKFRLGKLPFAQALADDFIPKVTSAGYLLLPISVEHALRAGRLTGDHKDPFDRMLAAQAIHEDLPIVSNDAQLDAFGVRRTW
ncbi:MAG TPA: type II toxin-antitoxin system VapC family toxin [Terracidiphilus sp.]|jgi:PIN domain nuclease of toxin-antitoxin system|nr:type II toxin-antitoxin system VapC family toxin [Terracidiphilus sp.]